MRRAFIIIAAAMAAVLGLTAPSLAASPHFVGQVRATDLGTQLQVSGSVAGLGNQNIDVEVIAEGTASVDCVNPGGNVAPGQRTSVTATGEVSNVEVKNGRANFTVTTETPVVPNTPTCPNPQWTAEVTDVEFSSFTVNVYQPAGSDTLVLSQTFPA
jgi:hypothetical protein